MTAYRTGYGTGLYGVRSYGLDGSVLPVSATAAAQMSVSCNAVRVRTFSATASVSSAASAIIGKAQAASATVAINAIFGASIRLLWEPEPDTPETWTGIAAASGTWTDVSSASEIWTEVA